MAACVRIKLPQAISSEKQFELLEEARKGSLDARNTLIESYMRLAANLAVYRKRHSPADHRAERIAVAFAAVVDGVDSLIRNRNSGLGAVTERIKGALVDSTRRKTVSLDGSSRSRGKKCYSINFKARDRDTNPEVAEIWLNLTTPAANVAVEAQELKELISLCAKTHDEKVFLSLLFEGYKLSEVARILNMKLYDAREMRKMIKNRFLTIFKREQNGH